MQNKILQYLRRPTTWMGLCAAGIVALVAMWPDEESETAPDKPVAADQKADPSVPLVPLSGTPETPSKVIVELPPAPPVVPVELPEIEPAKPMPAAPAPAVVAEKPAPATTTPPPAPPKPAPVAPAAPQPTVVVRPLPLPASLAGLQIPGVTKSQVTVPMQPVVVPPKVPPPFFVSGIASAPAAPVPAGGSKAGKEASPAVIARATAPAEPQAVAPPAVKPEEPAKGSGPVVTTSHPPGEEKMSADGEFGHDSHEKGTVATTEPAKEPSARISVPTEPKPEPPPPAAPEVALPTDSKVIWKVVKRDGHDYVTGSSLQRFYGFATYKVDGKNVWLRRPDLVVKAQLGAQELLINNIKFILSYPVTQEGGEAIFSRLDLCKLIDPVLRPNYIGNGGDFDTVVVDAGHGGHDSGAKGVYGYEKDFTLSMAQAVRASLIQRGLKVVMTRSTDVFITLGGRVAIANQTPNSIFVSLHFNSGDSSSATGIETFALSPQGSSSTFMGQRSSDYAQFSGNNQDGPNIALATAVHGQVIHRFKVVDRGIKRARWTVLTGCQKPGILFEGGFVTSPTDCRYIASDSYRKALSEAIADAIVNYRRALGQQRVQRR
ncbi:MAG: N-acetylmuramoyl-L-alanine amidase [Verrucomicrobiales bacterium]|nr:N-acetylmuramoyl-L-alanine amidase [Verrucomicrobiales bacterium]MCP5556719.1 N-acetylmuramoyl-L-alanine amidase [Verrucomicrobiaceae bacterium]